MPAPPRLAVVTDPRFDAHVPPGFHPERPERLAAARRGLASAVPAFASSVELPARLASHEELTRAHSSGYVERLERVLGHGTGYIDADTYFSPGSRNAAFLAAGGACALVDALVDGDADTGILLARPPGHHATHDRAMGFCLINHIAVAARHARARGLSRVAIVDWDVHHGNGTQDILWRDPSVLFISLHQIPLYPGSGAADEIGEGDARGSTVNVPLPPGSDGATYACAFERVVLPLLAERAPEIVLVSAGYDAHERDPLASMALRASDFERMAAQVRQVANKSAGGRVALFLEGGYDLRALEECVASSLRGLASAEKPEIKATECDRDALESIDRVIAIQKPFWSGVL